MISGFLVWKLFNSFELQWVETPAVFSSVVTDICLPSKVGSQRVGFSTYSKLGFVMGKSILYRVPYSAYAGE